jgi:hypothetical protein
MTDLQKVSNFFDFSDMSFWRTPESSNIKGLLNTGVRRHDEKQMFTTFCDAIKNTECGFIHDVR